MVTLTTARDRLANLRRVQRTWPAGIGAVLLLFAAAGCASRAELSARSLIAAGDLRGAHQKITALLARLDLNPADRRRLSDELCLVEFNSGVPAYSLVQQRATCIDAAKTPGSSSGPILAQIESAMMTSAAERTDSAIESHDLAAAEASAFEYASIPGADQTRMRTWSAQMWSLADESIPQSLAKASAKMPKPHPSNSASDPKVVNMDDREFHDWIRSLKTKSGTSPITTIAIAIDDQTIELGADEARTVIAGAVDLVAQVNDAMAARCQCPARTRVSASRSGLPLYLAYIDRDLTVSAVIILPHSAPPGSPD